MKYPECEKLREVHSQSQVIGQFLDWLQHEKRISLAEYDEYDRLQWAAKKNEDLLAEFFDIDLKKVEEERRAILDELRKANKAAARKAKT